MSSTSKTVNLVQQQAEKLAEIFPGREIRLLHDGKPELNEWQVYGVRNLLPSHISEMASAKLYVGFTMIKDGTTMIYIQGPSVL